MYFNELLYVDYHTDFDFELHLHMCLAVIDRHFNSPNLSPVKQSSISCPSCNLEKLVWKPAKSMPTAWSLVLSFVPQVLQLRTVTWYSLIKRSTVLTALKPRRCPAGHNNACLWTLQIIPKQDGGFFEGRHWYFLVNGLLAPSTSRCWIHFWKNNPVLLNRCISWKLNSASVAYFWCLHYRKQVCQGIADSLCG